MTMAPYSRLRRLAYILIFSTIWVLVPTSYARNEVLGEIQLEGAGKVAKDSGVWVDGQYLGYLKELKGTKRILLLPGEHQIEVRQAGYRNFSEQVTVAPGAKQVVRVTMEKDLQVAYPTVTAEIKLAVEPVRAAVFVDGLLLGHVAEFEGAGRGLLVAPGRRKITISLPGYQTSETVVDLVPHQVFKLTTNLVWNGVAANSTEQ
jgi:PEGA domain